jgi:hypothetical protein
MAVGKDFRMTKGVLARCHRLIDRPFFQLGLQRS